MKNRFKLFGIVAIVAAVGLSMTACDDGSQGSQSQAEVFITNNSSNNVTFTALQGTTVIRSSLGSPGLPVQWFLPEGTYRIRVTPADWALPVVYWPSVNAGSFISGTVRLSFNGTSVTRQ